MDDSGEFDDDRGLRTSLSDLAGLITEGKSLTEILSRIATFAAAAVERRTVRSGSLGGDSQWPRFGPRIGRLGVHSVLSLPLLISERTVGAINVYARAKDAFDDRAVELGELFASPAAVAVHNAQVLARAFELTEQLQTALASRPIIDQAIGLVRARAGVSAEAAIAELREVSRTAGRKLVDIAQDLVEEAVAAARARHEGR